MSDEKNRSFLSDYEKFRTLLRTVFFFGSFTIDDFLRLEQLGIKKTQYQNYKRIAEDIIDKLSNHLENHKIALKYDVEQFEMNYNYLSESYFIKTLTPLEASMTIYILLLISGNNGCNEYDIYTIMGMEEQDEKTVRAKIRSMINNGLIVYKDSRYYIADNPLYSMPEHIFINLLIFVDFQKNRIYPNCFGSFLYSTMCRIYQKRFSKKYESPFTIKYNHLGNILDDEIQWEILRAIYDRKTVSFWYNPNDYAREIIDIIPFKLLTEDQQNRIYLFGIRRTAHGDKKRFFRLDKISQLKITGNVPDNYKDTDMQAFYEDSTKHLFSNIPVTSQDTVLIELEYSECMQNEIKRQFNTVSFDEEKHIAKVLVKAEYKSLNPWLRYHADTIKILNDCAAEEAFNQEMLEMKRLYGIIS